MVLLCEKLNRTTPCSTVPSALCISGAQCAPARTVVLPQDIGHPGRVLVSDIQGDDGRTQSGLNVAVYSHARHTAYFFVKTASQCSFAGGQRFHALCQKPLYSGAKPGKAVHVQGAGFQCGGHLGGMLLVIAVHAAAAHYKGRDLHTRTHIQPAGALRPQ